jgi:hypothetical protein
MRRTNVVQAAPWNPQVVRRCDRPSNPEDVLVDVLVLRLLDVALREPADVAMRHAELDDLYERILPHYRTG